MYRTRFESLEQRKMFSVTDLILDPISITDGTSNTLMLSEDVAPIDVDLLGALVNTSPIEVSAVSLDVWEHAYSDSNRPAANGIIAVLIGLAADPSDPRGNVAGAAALADGSVRRVAASLLASDEYFSRFSDTTIDDESLVATTFGRGLAPSKITHDAEFEKWADASAFDQGSSPSAFYDLLISSILHEENEFSFPRMFTGGVYVG